MPVLENHLFLMLCTEPFGTAANAVFNLCNIGCALSLHRDLQNGVIVSLLLGLEQFSNVFV